MTRGNVLDPTARRDDDIPTPGPDAGLLAGKRVGFRLDRMWRAWDWISELWAEKLRAAGAEVSYWRSGGRSGEEGERNTREYEAFLQTIDIAVVGLANCGSCTGWTVRDAISAAQLGLPTVAVATANFADFSRDIAARGGRSGLRLHVLPYPLNEQVKNDVLVIGESHFEQILGTMGARLVDEQSA